MSNPNPQCLFCRISRGDLPATVRHETDDLIVINDIHPKAPVHLLIIPKQHIPSLADASDADEALLGRLLLTARDMARDLKIDPQGYRVVINTRHHGGQEVDHLHVHLLGGEPLGPMRA